MTEYVYTREEIREFVTMLAAVTNQQYGARESETYERLVTVKAVAEDLARLLVSEEPGDTHINWVQHHTGMLQRYAADLAERHGSREAPAAVALEQGEQRFIEHVTSRGWVEQTPADQWTSGAQAADRLFSLGDVVRLHVDLNVSYVDDDLAAEDPGARVRVRRPRGSIGIVTKVRDYQTPFPYVVMFGDQEASVAERDLERVAPESGER